MSYSEELRRFFLAGIGAIATTAEQSKEVVDAFVQKGELTVEQGKVLNEELKHNIRKTVKKTESEKPSADVISDLLDRMTPEEIAALKEQILRKEADAMKEDDAEPAQ